MQPRWMTAETPSAEGKARRGQKRLAWWAIAALVGCAGSPSEPGPEQAGSATVDQRPRAQAALVVDPGPRAQALLDVLVPGALRDRLESCRQGPFRASRFAIGHRGAPLHHPEHTRESYVAAARMGAGVLECDVTVTADGVLVCRHAQCDLATTTDLLESELADRCREPFHPAEFDSDTGALLAPAGATCCTSDLSLDEFRRLRGRHDRVDLTATSLEAFLAPQLEARPETRSFDGTLMTHAESITLFRALGVAMTPELKAFDPAPNEGTRFSRRILATRMIDAYREASVPPRDVWPQSFEIEDLAIWQEVAPDYAERAIWLDGRDPSSATPPLDTFIALRARGVRRIAPPLSRLLELDRDGALKASGYARHARTAGLELVTWTLERSGPIEEGRAGGRDRDFYLTPILPVLRNDGDLYLILDALHREVGVRAIFSDSPSAPVLYASCLALE